MSNLGFQAVYRLFSQIPRFSVDRAYLPDEEGEIRTFEKNNRLSELDIIAISASFETDYLHLLQILEAAGVSLEERLEVSPRKKNSQLQRPFLLGGGAALTLNPEPVANFFDAIVIGEGEEVVEEISACYLTAREEDVSFQAFLERLSTIEGVYVPSLYRVNYREDGKIGGFSNLTARSSRVKRRYVSNIDSVPTHTVIKTPNTEFRAMFMTETGRGCEVGCKFCVAGYMYRPTRKRSEGAIFESLKIGLEQADSIGFVGAAVSSHPAISKLAKFVADKGKRAALSSIMSQKVTKELASSLTESEYKTVALAPEAGSERLRFSVGKRVCNEQIVDGVKTLAKEGILNFKLYFIVGLPSETIEDVHEIPRLISQVRQGLSEETSGWRKTMPRIVLSVNPFIPKAWTPFQRHGMLPHGELKRRLEIVRKGVSKISNVEMKNESPRESYFQALLSRGDRRVGDILVSLYRSGGDWKSLVNKGDKEFIVGIPPLDFYVQRTLEADEICPWEIVDLRIKRELLEREYLDTFNEDVTPLIYRARSSYQKQIQENNLIQEAV